MSEQSYRTGIAYRFLTLILVGELMLAVVWACTQVILLVQRLIPTIPVLPLFLAPIIAVMGICAAVSEEKRCGAPRWPWAIGIPTWLVFSLFCAIQIVLNPYS